MAFKFLRALRFVLLVGFVTQCQPGCPKCPPMWTFYNGHCYRYFGTGKTFDEAEVHCKEFFAAGQGHLASITSLEENELLFKMWKLARGTTSGGLWIGLTDQAEEGSWVWVDGSPVTFSRWHSDQPDNAGDGQHCASFWRIPDDGRWDDEYCNYEYMYPYICKMATYVE